MTSYSLRLPCFSIAKRSKASQLSLPAQAGSQEFDVETSSILSGQIGGEFDTTSLGSKYPKYCFALYNYKVDWIDWSFSLYVVCNIFLMLRL